MYTETEAAIPPRPGRDFDHVVGEHRVGAEVGARKAVAQVLGDDGEVEVDAFVGDPGDTLVELSAYLDLLVSGSRGYGPVRAVLLGGVARRLATAGHCPVIVLPRRRGAARRAARRGAGDRGSGWMTRTVRHT
jgi:nucleotide-binding universal stress UspA family protein